MIIMRANGIGRIECGLNGLNQCPLCVEVACAGDNAYFGIC